MPSARAFRSTPFPHHPAHSQLHSARHKETIVSVLSSPLHPSALSLPLHEISQTFASTASDLQKAKERKKEEEEEEEREREANFIELKKGRCNVTR